VHLMLIQVRNEGGSGYFAAKHGLAQAIRERKIRQLRRSDGWLTIDGDQRSADGNEYDGPERRMSDRIDGSLFRLGVRDQLRAGLSVEAVLGYGQRPREIAARLKSVAGTNLSVLIQGKTGTGKGVAAVILHELSERKDKPLVRVDCGALPPTLIESELFGYEKGSFTGAVRSKPGRFQSADGGTIFLDEVANLSLDMQTRLLGFLEERLVNSIGTVHSVKLNVRVVSATNADLMEQVRKYQFREDLFYRLNEFMIEMPPLRERIEDIPYLATKFLIVANGELGKKILGFSEDALDCLLGCDWHGNIRELRNAIRRAALFAGEVIEAEHLQNEAMHREEPTSLDGLLEKGIANGLSLHAMEESIRREAEKRIIQRMYEQSHQNKKRTCEALGIDYSTLYRKMKNPDT
jgi:two-component system, NtrC family, response regulator HydG